MAFLSDELRKNLAEAIGRETDVTGARIVAETAAKLAIERIGVHLSAPPKFLNEAERELRRRLRIHARQLGDALFPDESQEIRRLTEACAYAHWHRMLFARFLVENMLLIPKGGAAISLEDCKELAEEHTAEHPDDPKDAWDLAASFAATMLPQIFRPDDPVLKVKLAAEHQKRLEGILSELNKDIFKTSDALGWCYQFWQARRKKQVNESPAKVGADEIGPVTQLFTEPYMVSFQLENSLGAWWVGAGRALPEGLDMPYLRCLEDGTPAAGRFEGWPQKVRDLKVLDPCCGSGHFLVAAFDILVKLRQAEDKLSLQDACDAVLRDNLHGLEIDSRCVQIAAFALALEAWKLSGYHRLPAMNVACCGLSVAILPVAGETVEEERTRLAENKKRRDRWVNAAGRDERKRIGMGRLFDIFADAPVLGSLVDPMRDQPDRLFCASSEDLLPVLEKVLREEAVSGDLEDHESHVVARGIAEAARLLSGKYTLVVTNPPYLGQKKQNKLLKDYCDLHYPDSRADIVNVFLDRCLELSGSNGTGTVQVVMPQNFLFLVTYKEQRASLLKKASWNLLVKLGYGSFQTPLNTAPILLTLTHKPAPTSAVLRGLDLSSTEKIAEKVELLQQEELVEVNQNAQIGNPDTVVLLSEPETGPRLEKYASCYQGSGLADIKRFRVMFWEIDQPGTDWVYHQSSPSAGSDYSGLHFLALWQDGNGELSKRSDARIQGRRAWGKKGVACAWMGNLPASLYGGWLYDNSAAVIVPQEEKHLPAIWAFCSSPEFHKAVRVINQKNQVANSTMVKVPFDLEYWQKVANEKYPDGLPKPYTDDPTQWIFHGHPQPSTSPLQVAMARLLGYRWPAEIDDTLELSKEAQVWLARSKELLSHMDQDGIVPIPALRGELSAADRLRALLRAAYGAGWATSREQALLNDQGFSGKSLEDWLRNGFFKQHCALFDQTPFLWHIWDGHKDGFAAIVNYHKFDYKNLEALTYSYLGDWIAQQRDATARNEAGSVARLEAAEGLQKRLKDILEGEPPYDIFVRWKAKEDQAIGWRPDLNDGLRLNIRPFCTALPGAKERGPSVLRDVPKLKWGKDAGKNPPKSLWGDERNNDLHLSNTEKREARSKGGVKQPDATDDSDEGDPPVSPRLKSLHLYKTGPIADTTLEFGDRLNLITGDNGLGKTFLLNVVWWALTEIWPKVPQIERNDEGLPVRTKDVRKFAEPQMAGDGESAADAILTLGFEADEALSYHYDFANYSWIADRKVKPTPRIVIYARADGGFSVFDPLRNRPEHIKPNNIAERNRLPAFQYGPDEWLLGGGKAMSGLISHWRDWQNTGDERWKFLLQVIDVLFTGSAEKLEPGPQVDRSDFDKRVPTLKMSYGVVPLPLVSSGVRRILTLAFVLVWTWYEHHRAATMQRVAACTHLSLLMDEVEVHLYPQWQRSILPAILGVLEKLSPKPEIQVFVATHSPFVLASVEVGLDEDLDRLFHVELADGRVSSMDLGAFKRGDILNWLTSDVFGLTQARSLEAERAIEAAEALMRDDMEEVPEAWRTSSVLHAELVRVLPGDDHFWPRWILHRRGRP